MQQFHDRWVVMRFIHLKKLRFFSLPLRVKVSLFVITIDFMFYRDLLMEPVAIALIAMDSQICRFFQFV